MSLFVWLLTTRRSTGKQVAALTLWAGGFLLVILIGLQVLSGGGLSSFHTGAKVSAWGMKCRVQSAECKVQNEDMESKPRLSLCTLHSALATLLSSCLLPRATGGST